MLLRQIQLLLLNIQYFLKDTSSGRHNVEGNVDYYEEIQNSLLLTV